MKKKHLPLMKITVQTKSSKIDQYPNTEQTVFRLWATRNPPPPGDFSRWLFLKPLNMDLSEHCVMSLSAQS